MTTDAAAFRRNALRHPISLVWAGVLVYSTGPVIVAASSVDGPGFSLLRLIIGVPVLWLLAARSSDDDVVDPGKARWWTLLAGVSFGAHQIALMTAVKLTSVTDVVLMNTLAPVVVTILAVPLFGERPGLRFRSWGLLAVLGAAVVAWAGSTGPSGDLRGMSLAVLNVVVFSVFFLCSKAARDHIAVWPFLARVISVAAVFVLAFVGLGTSPWPDPTGLDLVLAALLAMGPGAIGHFLMTWPLRWVPANLPPIVRLVQPFLSGGLAWLVLGQHITLTHIAGGALTIVGVGGALGAWRSGSSAPPPSADRSADAFLHADPVPEPDANIKTKERLP